MSTKVYGVSDDLIEFEGELRGEVGYIGRSDEEFCLVAFSDGTVARIRYSHPGIWKVDLLNKGSLFDRLDICTDEDATPYSDVLHFKDGKLKAWAGEWKEQVR